MDVEFHYYITYLIAARAGFSPDDARTIACSAQQVDDNCNEYQIKGSLGLVYRNYISQTMNIERPRDDLLRIYPLFHFVPGDPMAISARRKDKKTSPWMTTPDNELAQEMLNAALCSGNLYRIGIAAHAYVDTWAHQNFIGKCDELNKCPLGLNIWNRIKSSLWNIINTGHGSFAHQPDKPALVWKDKRLENDTVDNRLRFLDAAEALYKTFVLYKDPSISGSSLTSNIASLRAELNEDIGVPDPKSSEELKEKRIARYRERARHSPYQGQALPEYDENEWFNKAVAWDMRNNQKVYSWNDPDNYQSTDWVKFVEAVKEHQNIFWPKLKNMDLEGIDNPEMSVVMT